MANLASYFEGLPAQAKNRYREKIKVIGSLDPFLLPNNRGLAATSKLPAVEASDIVSYLVLQTSYLTAKQFKAHKALESYNQFVNGWVKNVEGWNTHGKITVTGRVRHSQRCNDTPLSCWVICESTGEICCGHCNCMAGLGEACTHIGAVLFYLEASTKMSSEQTCTQSKCQWVIPRYQGEIPYLPIKDLDFSSAKKKQETLTSQMQSSSQHERCNVSVSTPDHLEMETFFKRLSESGTRPVILSIVSPYSDEYIPKVIQPNFPKPLQQLYDKECLKLDYLQLLAVCEQVNVTLTKEMAVAVEQETRTQSSCNLWFTYRAGRITASRMKSACRTDPTNPSQSLIKVISYPEAFKFRSKATSWGCKHEKQARQTYTKKMLESHHEFSVTDSGLTLNPKWPFLGASPDGVVNCHCCSKGVVEIKCPYCHCNDDIIESTMDKKFCLKKDACGTCYLDKTHSYYYQVQTQIFVCEVGYCDFVVCTFPEGHSEPNIHIERLHADNEFWSICVEKSSELF